jgi:hypothetical protein
VLLEAFAPRPDARELHEISIAAPPDVVYRDLWKADFGDSPIVRALLALRSLPEVVVHGAPANVRTLTLPGIIEAGFGKLAEEPDREIVLGVSGRFWRGTGNLEPFRRDAFTHPVPAGMARAVWNFMVRPNGERGTILSTETRVTCGDPASRFKFRLYWLAIRPFRGLIRINMLRAVKRAAEARAAEERS